MAIDQVNPPSQSSLAPEDFESELKGELDQSKKTLKDLTLIQNQSQSELAKIVQKNASLTGQLTQNLNMFGKEIPEEVKGVFQSALETQQRMIVLRGQLEKLQSEQNSLNKYIVMLQKAINYSHAFNKPADSGKGDKKINSIEMLVNAQESERQRLSRQMHDGPAQAMSNFIVQADIASRFLDIDAIKAKEELTNLKTSAMSTFQKIRGFISDLRPMMLDDLGLVPTLRRYLDNFKEENNVEINFSISGGEKRLQPFLEVMIFRAVQDLVDNAVQYNLENPGKLQIAVQLVLDVDQVKASVADNGVGFDPDILSNSSGLGLKLIRERVEILGGKFEIDSSPGKGSTIYFSVPYVELKPESKR
jgi:two-component system, NarL family, sensor histidine kinase DegS